MKFLQPNVMKKSILEIDLDEYLDKKAIICDVDNTLCCHDEEMLSSERRAWIERAKLNFQVILISNNHKGRIERLANSLGCKAYGFSLKPLKHTYKKILRENNLKVEEVLCIGDQIMTDIIGAKRMKMDHIYVQPLSDSDIVYTKLSRKIENWLLKEKI